MDFFEAARELADERMRCERQSAAHRMDHIERVLQNINEIAGHYPEADMEVLRLSALLHDVDQPFDRKEEHAELSARAAADVLSRIGYPHQKIEKVLEIISEHSTEGSRRPTSLEARILFDADKLDGLGASGIARVFTLFGHRGRPPLEAIPWYLRKMELAANGMQTDEGRSLAFERSKYVLDFLAKIQEENRPVE